MHPKRTIPQDLFENEALLDRFWSKVAVGDPSDCWPFVRGRNGQGYGKFLVAVGNLHFAHRVAWALHHRQNVPEGMRVLHRCDNPPCCNPGHLFIGSMNDNMRDMWQKRRHPNVAKRGESSNFARLEAADVLAIRALAGGSLPQWEIAARYGVTQTNVSQIIRRVTWKHV